MSSGLHAGELFTSHFENVLGSSLAQSLSLVCSPDNEMNFCSLLMTRFLQPQAPTDGQAFFSMPMKSSSFILPAL